MHENACNHDDSSNHDDPDDHEMVQESVNMCLNVLKRPVSALYYKIISIYTTIDTSLNLLTGLFTPGGDISLLVYCKPDCAPPAGH